MNVKIYTLIISVLVYISAERCGSNVKCENAQSCSQEMYGYSISKSLILWEMSHKLMRSARIKICAMKEHDHE